MPGVPGKKCAAMSRKKTPCPICRKEVVRSEGSLWPFCSERCKLIDLGRWADEQYRIPEGGETPVTDHEV